eukprot:1876410-Amphidinium_carterae.1
MWWPPDGLSHNDQPKDKGHQVQVLWKRLFTLHSDTGTQTFAATPFSMVMRLLLTIAILKQFTVFTIDVASAFLNSSIDTEVLVQQPPKEYYDNNPHVLWSMTKALYGLKTSPKQWQEHVSTILQQLGFKRLKKRRLCVCQQWIDDLHHGVRRRPTCYWWQCYNTTVPTPISATLRLKHTSQLTKTTPLELPGKTIELQDDGTIHLSFATILPQDLEGIQHGRVQSINNSWQQETAKCSSTT